MWQKLLEKFRAKDKILFLFSVGLLLNIITFALLFLQIKTGKQTLALRYNIIAGVEVFGKGYTLYQLPLIGLFILFINYLFYKRIKGLQEFLAFLTAFVSLISQVILLIAVILLIRLAI